jgi:hypothetical protein
MILGRSVDLCVLKLLECLNWRLLVGDLETGDWRLETGRSELYESNVLFRQIGGGQANTGGQSVNLILSQAGERAGTI